MRIFTRHRLVLLSAIALAGGGLALALSLPAQRGPAPPVAPGITAASFSWGTLAAGSGGASGCGVNGGVAGITAVSEQNNVFVAAQRAAGAGVDAWTGAEQPGGTKADACSMSWAGAVGGLGDVPPAAAWAPQKNEAGTYSLYVAGGADGAPVVARSTDNGITFVALKLNGRLFPGARPSLAAEGAATVLVSYRDPALGRLSVQRSDDGGASFAEAGPLLATADRRSPLAELGNLVIDPRARASGAGPFVAYQALFAPRTAKDRSPSQPFLAVSKDGAKSWSQRRVGCAGDRQAGGHEVPAAAVSPDGSVWYAWADGESIHSAVSRDQGASWRCYRLPGAGLKGVAQPALAASEVGVNVAFYGSQTRGSWALYLAQNPSGKGWLAPEELMIAHEGSADSIAPPALAVDRLGWLHLAYSADGEAMEPSSSQIVYAVQSGGAPTGTK